MKRRELLIIIIFAFFLLMPFKQVFAQEACGKIKLNVIARNGNGDFIPNVYFEVFKQETDVDGFPKPGKKLAAGRTSPLLGRGSVFLEGGYDVYALKFKVLENKAAAYYFYNYNWSCGEEVEVEERLGSIKILFRTADGDLIKNQNFSLYTQRYDADGRPIREKQDLIGIFNTSLEGEKEIFVPGVGRTIDGTTGGYYILQTVSSDGGKYLLYNIDVLDGVQKEINYILSDFYLTVKDADGALFPSKTKIKIYKQIEDENGEKKQGSSVKEIFTDDNGVATLIFPAGIYLAEVVGKNNVTEKFWDLEIFDQERNEYELITGKGWQPGGEVCAQKSQLNVIVKNHTGKVIPNIKYVLYEQGLNASGLPIIGREIKKGIIGNNGVANILFNPDPRKSYALKLYQLNPGPGAFWYLNEIKLSCGENKTIEKRLSAVHIILRNDNNELLKNKNFSIYTQRYDTDGKPIKARGSLVKTKINTGEKGEAIIYLSPYADKEGRQEASYVFSADYKSKDTYTEYGLRVPVNEDLIFDYMFSGLVLILNDARDKVLTNKKIQFYYQTYDLSGNYALGKKFMECISDSGGRCALARRAGKIVAVITDSAGQKNIFWNIKIKNRQKNRHTLRVNSTRVYAKYADGENKNPGTIIRLYSLQETENENFYKNKKLKEFKLNKSSYLDISLSSGPYLLTVKEGKNEYGQAFFAENNRQQEVIIKILLKNRVKKNRLYKLKKPYLPEPLAKRLAGRVLLQVELHGEAWYVDPESYKRYYLRNGDAAYDIMRSFGLGISNENLSKIQIGLDERFVDFDYDADYIPDKMEEALGTDMRLDDSDHDGYKDGEEIKNGFNPLGEGKLVFDEKLADKLRGRILLQVESHGEAWYVNPNDNKRYYMKDGDSAYQIMRFLSLGITNDNLAEIEKGVLF